jgi:hypothetical protein
MAHRSDRRDLGPLFTITEEELVRPARRREDRDVLVLRIEIEAQRREVARLTTILGARQPGEQIPALGVAGGGAVGAIGDRLLLSSRDLRKALGVSATTLWRWTKDGRFPPQIHIGSASWNRATNHRSKHFGPNALVGKKKSLRARCCGVPNSWPGRWGSECPRSYWRSNKSLGLTCTCARAMSFTFWR